VLARRRAHGSTAAALLVLRHREGRAPVHLPGGSVVALLALLACAAIVASASLAGVRDGVIVRAGGLAVRAAVRLGNPRSTVRTGGYQP
jgi:hypothetical protein